MSQENVEIVRRGNALFNAGDWDAAFALWHDDVEYRDLQHGPDMPEVVNGHEGLRRVAAMWAEVYDDFGAEVYQYIDADPWVVCDTRWYGRGKGSDVATDVHVADTYEVKDGKIARAIMSYPDVASAIQAVGLQE
jgi:ketosteroid isomerase-like protein